MTTITLAQSKKIKAAITILEKSAVVDSEAFSSAEFSKEYFRLRIASASREIFSVAFLTTSHHLIAAEDMFIGTINQCAVYPREIAKRALELNAQCVIRSHNHPSGNATPSASDDAITKRIKEGLALFDIRMLDHIIVTRCSSYSYAEAGIL
jgi:DNA repair protein RadC